MSTYKLPARTAFGKDHDGRGWRHQQLLKQEQNPPVEEPILTDEEKALLNDGAMPSLVDGSDVEIPEIDRKEVREQNSNPAGNEDTGKKKKGDRG